MRDLWWFWLGWATATTISGLALGWAAMDYLQASRCLLNAYRAELGEPPLHPDHTCRHCRPIDHEARP